MFCYAVWDKGTNRQLRVFPYQPLESGDYKRAFRLAIDMAKSLHKNGYPCIVESFGACDVGVTVFDSEKGTE